MNRLADSTSPYLLQHKDNPVDWWPWCDDAFAEAQRLDRPVLLSVGYAACHWCHVMAHESFEDAATAAYLNEHFVAIKVDREERPDVDAVYMEATQALTGHGRLADDGVRSPRRPAVLRRHLLPARAAARHAVVPAAAAGDPRGLAGERARRGRRGEPASPRRSASGRSPGDGGTRPPTRRDAARPARRGARRRLRRGARRVRRGAEVPALDGRSSSCCATTRVPATRRALAMVEGTCGRWHAAGCTTSSPAASRATRSTRDWVVPHFEKMLYDNALLLRVVRALVAGDRRTRSPSASSRRRRSSCCARCVRPRAASPPPSTPTPTGVEGSTYVWTPAQLVEVLGAEDGAWAAALLGVDGPGRSSTARRCCSCATRPGRRRRAGTSVRARLLAARDARPQPGRDDKVVSRVERACGRRARRGRRTAGRARAGRARPRRRGPARQRAPGRRRPAGAGVARRGRRRATPACWRTTPTWPRDSSCCIGVPARRRGCSSPASCSTSSLRALRRRATAASSTPPTTPSAWCRRPQDPTDNATPSGWSAAAGALLSYAALTGSEPHRDGRGGGAALGALAGALPRASPGGPWRSPRRGWTGRARSRWSGRTATHAPRCGAPPCARRRRGRGPSVGEADAPAVPLLAGRPLVAGVAAAYVCRRFVCDAPVTDPAELADLLR